MLYLIDQFWPSVFVSSVSAGISLICAKVGRDFVLVCDVGKPIVFLLSAVQRSAKGRLLMESVSVFLPAKNLNTFCCQIPRYGSRFLQFKDNKLGKQVYRTTRLTGSWNSMPPSSLSMTGVIQVAKSSAAANGTHCIGTTNINLLLSHTRTYFQRAIQTNY